MNRGRRHTGHGARGTLHWVIYDQGCGVPVCSMSMCVCVVSDDDLAMKKREVSENSVRWGRHVPVPAAAVTTSVA